LHVFEILFFNYYLLFGRDNVELDPYRNFAELYDFVVGPLNISLKRVRIKLAPPIQGMNVLDVGCGTGSDLELYHQEGCNVYGVDLSPSMLNVARKKFGEGADLRLCDAAQLPFQNESFDLILSTYTLHEMIHANRSAVIQEMIRVVKKDGRILLTDFSPRPYSFPIGWIHRTSILIFETIAGREHFNNGLDFLNRGGILELIQPYQLDIESATLVGGGTTAFFLLRTY
jgi:ubiquinone/menaquinone biosynthesis C-methylase UbiE